MKRYRILSIDGGGIRGLIPAILLDRISQKVPGWLDNVDLIAGTSVGGLIALGLAHGLETGKIRSFFEEKGPGIFDDSWLDDLIDIGKLTGADYSNRALTKEVKDLFGRTTLGQLKKRVLITTFDLDNKAKKKRTWKPKLFHNFSGRDSDRKMPVYKVALFTSAAPTYFPSVDGFVDGGVYANNPSMCALAQTQDTRSLKQPPSFGDVVMLSLGTGAVLKYIKGKNLDWGYGQWAKPIIDIMLEGVAGIADYQCRKILGKRYRRLNPAFGPGKSVPLDGVDRMKDLLTLAESHSIKATVKWLKATWV